LRRTTCSPRDTQCAQLSSSYHDDLKDRVTPIRGNGLCGQSMARAPVNSFAAGSAPGFVLISNTSPRVGRWRGHRLVPVFDDPLRAEDETSGEDVRPNDVRRVAMVDPLCFRHITEVHDDLVVAVPPLRRQSLDCGTDLGSIKSLLGHYAAAQTYVCRDYDVKRQQSVRYVPSPFRMYETKFTGSCAALQHRPTDARR
jgi:hypothetical protein